MRMPKQENLYLLKHRELPRRIFESLEVVRAIQEFGGSAYTYRPIAHWEAHLLQPDIHDYLRTIA